MTPPGDDAFWTTRRAVRLAIFAVVVLLCDPEQTLAQGGNEPSAGVSIGPMIVVTVAWFAALGACVGSFLNVVVYRLPLGLNLSSPGSRCPVCETPILRRDNVPVLGWLWLRGRCRACQAPISVRYPLVEALVGVAFVALLFAELSSGGRNLPVRDPNALTGLAWTLWGLKWGLIGLYLYHAAFVALLVSAGLIAFDGQSTRRLLWPALLLGLIPPIVWPHLHPVPLAVPRPEWLDAVRLGIAWTDGWVGQGDHFFGVTLAGALEGVAGVLSGTLLGLVLRVGVPADRPNERFNVVATAAFVGTFLGWQAVWSIGWAAGVLWVATAAATRRRDTATVCLCLAAAAQLLLWRALGETDFWPSYRGLPLLGTFGWLTLPLVPLLAALAVHAIPRRADSELPLHDESSGPSAEAADSDSSADA